MAPNWGNGIGNSTIIPRLHKVPSHTSDTDDVTSRVWPTTVEYGTLSMRTGLTSLLSLVGTTKEEEVSSRGAAGKKNQKKSIVRVVSCRGVPQRNPRQGAAA
eukprot:scaffold18498_cov186-Amphora_coffeaeformis.AAC.1